MNSDQEGFLIPDSRLSMDAMTTGIKGVKRDTAMIVRLLKGQIQSTVLQRARPGNPNNGSQASRRQPDGDHNSSPVIRDRAPPGAGTERAVRQITQQQAQQAAIERRAEASRRNREGDNPAHDQARDANGRFGTGGSGDDDGKTEGKDGLFSRLKSALSGNAGNSDLDKIDPTIEATNELRNLVGGPLKSIGEIGKSVIGRGFSSDNKPVPWYRRMLVQLKLMRKDDGIFQRTELRRLEEIRNGAGGGGSAGPGFLGSMLGGIGGKLGGLGSLLAGAGKGLLKRIPLLGGLLAGGSALASIFGGDDPTKSPEENRKARFTGGGSGIGALIGGGIGMLAGPGGAIVGGIIGDKVGELVGAWLSTVDWKEVGNKITSAWDSATSYLKEKFGPVIDNIKEKAAPAIKIVKEAAAPVIDAVKKKVMPIAKTVSSATDWILGKTSKLFESGNGGAGTVSTGKGDRGGVSYGTYQMSSKTGTVDNFLKGSKYGKEFDGLKSGTPEFDAKWKAVAASDPKFAVAQHDFIKQTHFDPQMDKLQAAGIDLSGRGAAVKDAVWSTAVQFGGKSPLIQSALKGKEVAKMTDEGIVSAIQDYKIANNDSLFKSSSGAVRASTLARASSEKDKLLTLSNMTASLAPALGENATMTAPLSASASIRPIAVSIPAPALPSPAPRADIPIPLNSKGPMVVTVKNDALAGQDVRDRRISAVASGGLSDY